MKEIWRDISGYEGLYQVSSLGRVRRSRLGQGTCARVLKQGIKETRTSYGRLCYYNVVLCKGGVPKTQLVHRLVLTAFVPNPESKPQVNHIDGNGLNNQVSNLEWATSQEQELHKWHVLGHQVKSPRFGYRSQPVKCVESGEVFRSKRAACIAMGIDRRDLYLHLRGGRESVKGLHWEEVGLQ